MVTPVRRPEKTGSVAERRSGAEEELTALPNDASGSETPIARAMNEATARALRLRKHEQNPTPGPPEECLYCAKRFEKCEWCRTYWRLDWGSPRVNELTFWNGLTNPVPVRTEFSLDHRGSLSDEHRAGPEQPVSRVRRKKRPIYGAATVFATKAMVATPARGGHPFLTSGILLIGMPDETTTMRRAAKAAIALSTRLKRLQGPLPLPNAEQQELETLCVMRERGRSFKEIVQNVNECLQVELGAVRRVYRPGMTLQQLADAGTWWLLDYVGAILAAAGFKPEETQACLEDAISFFSRGAAFPARWPIRDTAALKRQILDYARSTGRAQFKD